jgi:hypothetical protein
VELRGYKVMWRLVGLSSICILLAAARANANISYEYVTDAVSNGGTIIATPGQNIAVNIYLQETLTGSSTSLIAADGGLFGFGVALAQSSGSGSVINASAGSVNSSLFSGPSDITPNSGHTASQTFTGAIGISSATGPNPDATGKILLASADIIAGSAGTTTTFQLQSLSGNQAGNTFTVNNGYNLDSTNNAPNGGATYTGAATPQGGFDTFTVQVQPAVVPEPSSLLLGAMAVAGTLLGLYRRKAKKAESTRGLSQD